MTNMEEQKSTVNDAPVSEFAEKTIVTETTEKIATEVVGKIKEVEKKEPSSKEQYTIEELADAAMAGKIFDKKVSRAMVLSAMKTAKKERATVAEAIKIVDDFSKKKVK